MPLTGGTRMLRARRKDCNVKPNRRLDRKSSRGMLYENEELRMRTITINAEVEQGQHALKKLRRENEQLRREMWCLRDEYDKMEKLLRKRDTDEEESNQESYGDSSRTDESDDEKVTITEMADGRREQKRLDEDETTDAERDYRKSGEFENGPNVRNFDGLSVIDEQTEETQTTESVIGGGSSSRGNSANRTLPVLRGYEDTSGGLEELPQQYGYGLPANPVKVRFKRRGFSPYDSESFPESYDSYEPRPASPYPIDGILQQDSYQKRYQVLQKLPMAAASDNSTSNGNPIAGWSFPDSTKSPGIPGYDIYGICGGEKVVEGRLRPEPEPEASRILANSEFQSRTGPDVFVTDGYPGRTTEGTSAAGRSEIPETMADDLEAKIEGIKICQKSEMDPKSNWIKMTSLTKSAVSQGGGETSPGIPRETPNPEKLTIEEFAGENVDDKEIAKQIHQRSVPCQISCDRDVRGKSQNGPEETAAESTNAVPTEEMPQTDKSGSSKYQSKLTVTLRTPPAAAAKPAEGKYPVGTMPRVRMQTRNFPQPPRFGIRPDATPTTRFQTFPTSGYRQPIPRTPATNADECLVNHYAGVRTHPNGLSGSLPRLPCPGIVSKPEIGLVSSSHIPVDDLEKGLDALPGEESLPMSASQSLLGKPVKIPPVPPPRTSSCPKSIIPPPPLSDVQALHQRFYRRGKPFQFPNSMEPKFNPPMYNPLLLSQPIATSSPTISLRATKYGLDSSFENLYAPKFQQHNFRDESSAEDVSRQRSRFREDSNSAGIRKLNKSLSSPSFGSFRTMRRRQADDMAGSVENLLSPGMPEAICMTEKKNEPKSSKNHAQQSNVSVSSSSGLETPMKTDRKKRRVSIQFKKKHHHHHHNHHQQQQQHQEDGKQGEENGSGHGILSVKGRKQKSRNDETDGTTSDRERTNSFSSRTSSLVTGSSSRRKFSNSSSRTYLNDDKIPWCGCWGNGCV